MYSVEIYYEQDAASKCAERMRIKHACALSMRYTVAYKLYILP